MALADISDGEALAAAFEGAEGVFVLIPPMFDPTPGFPESRSVSASLKSALMTVHINEKTFVFLVDEMPYFALHTMRNLVERLRRMNEQWLALQPRVLSGS